MFQLRRREFEETFTTEDDSASSSPIKDITAKLKHLKILKLFRRNKNSRDNLVTISSINPDMSNLRDSGTETIQGKEFRVSSLSHKKSNWKTIHRSLFQQQKRRRQKPIAKNLRSSIEAVGQGIALVKQRTQHG